MLISSVIASTRGNVAAAKEWYFNTPLREFDGLTAASRSQSRAGR